MEENHQATPQGNGMAVTSLVLGIAGFALGLIPFIGWILLPAWILAIVFGAIGLKKYQSKGMCWTGLVLGIISFIYKFGFWILVAIGSSTGSS